MQESGIKPNWFRSIHSNIKGFSSRLITNPSATLDNRKCYGYGSHVLVKVFNRGRWEQVEHPLASMYVGL